MYFHKRKVSSVRRRGLGRPAPGCGRIRGMRRKASFRRAPGWRNVPFRRCYNRRMLRRINAPAPALTAPLLALARLLFRSRFLVRGDSMTPALRDGDLVQTLPRPWLRHGLRRGAVVVTRFPGAAGPETVAVKRIVALPGEYVRMAADGGILVNDVPLPEPYLPGGRPASGEHFPAWLCDDDEYFLLGDNRAPRESADSRRYGPAPAGSIIGLALFRWPRPRRSRRSRRGSAGAPAARGEGAR